MTTIMTIIWLCTMCDAWGWTHLCWVGSETAAVLSVRTGVVRRLRRRSRRHGRGQRRGRAASNARDAQRARRGSHLRLASAVRPLLQHRSARRGRARALRENVEARASSPVLSSKRGVRKRGGAQTSRARYIAPSTLTLQLRAVVGGAGGGGTGVHAPQRGCNARG
jgi:hypothetical protein